MKKKKIIKSWAGMPKDARELRAARAVMDDDRDELKILLDAYLLLFSRGGVDTSPETKRAYWNGAQRLLNWCSENGAKPHSVESDDVCRFVASMGDVSAKSRQLYMIGSKKMVEALRWAGMGRGDLFVKENGARIVIKDPDKDTVKAEPYTASEIEKLMSGANERECALILLGIDGGLRVGEMAVLEWGGVNADWNVLKFTGKGGKMAHQRVNPRTIDALQKMRNGESGRVFGISVRRLQEIFQRRCIDAGVLARGVHNLRHSCGTLMYSNTKDLLSVKRHLRHSSFDGVAIYINLAEGDYESAVRSLDNSDREPETALEVVESWAGLSDGEMKRKAAEAENTDNRDSLLSLLDSFVLTCTKSGTDTSPRTVTAYRQGANKLLDWCSANGLKPHEITSKDVRRFIGSMHELKPKSKQLYFTGAKTMHAALQWAGMGDNDPFVEKGGVPIKIRNPNGKGKPNPFTNDEVAKLLDGVGDLLKAIIYLGIDGGLRSAEMVNLKWGGVFPETNELEFVGKGRKNATQYTTNRTFDALSALPGDRVGPVLGIDTRKMRQIFEDRCEAVGVRKRGLHGLRHTAGTRMYAKTKCLLAVRDFLRHSSTVGSEGYAQLDLEEYKKAVHSLEEDTK